MEGKGEEVIDDDDDDDSGHLFYDQGEREGERETRKTRGAGTFHISLRVFNVDRPFFALLFPPSFTS